MQFVHSLCWGHPTKKIDLQRQVPIQRHKMRFVWSLKKATEPVTSHADGQTLEDDRTSWNPSLSWRFLSKPIGPCHSRCRHDFEPTRKRGPASHPGTWEVESRGTELTQWPLQKHPGEDLRGSRQGLKLVDYPIRQDPQELPRFLTTGYLENTHHSGRWKLRNPCLRWTEAQRLMVSIRNRICRTNSFRWERSITGR